MGSASPGVREARQLLEHDRHPQHDADAQIAGGPQPRPVRPPRRRHPATDPRGLREGSEVLPARRHRRSVESTSAGMTTLGLTVKVDSVRAGQESRPRVLRHQLTRGAKMLSALRFPRTDPLRGNGYLRLAWVGLATSRVERAHIRITCYCREQSR